MALPPARSSISGTPTNAQANTGLGQLYDYLVNLLGTAGTAADARTRLGAVGTTGDQTIEGVKTFSSPPVVPADSFSFAQLQNIAPGTLLGRSSAGTGDVEALTRAGAVREALTEIDIIELNARGNGDRHAHIDFHSAGTPLSSDLNARIIKYPGADAFFEIINTGSGGIILTTGAAGLFVNGLPSFACRAWVNFNGTGTVAIRASGNVSSITDNGVGDYTVNFTSALADANYSATIGTTADNISFNGQITPRLSFVHTTATGSCRVVTGAQSGDAGVSSLHLDYPMVSVAIFR